MTVFGIPGAVLLLSVMIGLPIVLIASWIQGTPVEWIDWAYGVAVGVMFGAAVGVMFGVAFSVAVGVVFGVVFSVAVGVAFGVAYGVAGSVAVGMAFSVAFSVAVGVAVGVMFGVAVGVVFGVAVGVMLGVAVGIAGSIFSEELLLAVSVLSKTVGLASVVGSLRAVFYPFQFIPALHYALRDRGRHPLEWDELTVLPMPGTRRALARRLQQDERGGLHFLTQVARNPFQRWAAQAALQSYLHNRSVPIRFVYELLAQQELDEYITAPVVEDDWKQIPNTRQLLLGELNGQWVDCSSNRTTRLIERLVWALTYLFRDHRITPLTRFAGTLYELLEEETVNADDFDLSAYSDIYTDLNDYPSGKEIAYTFEAMAAFLSYDDLSNLRTAATSSLEMIHSNLIRPTVLSALNELRRVGEEIATYQDATSRVNQLAALARATDALDDLDEYVLSEVMAPEQYILRRIIRQWRRLVSEAGGEVGRIEQLGPVANPYVAGNPVIGEIFVGREDILRRLEELWSGTGQKPSVVLYGHRRMGKSSILHNLGARFGPQTIIVDFNMQRVGLVESTGGLLYNLALALYDAQILKVADTFEHFAEPSEEAFVDHNPYTAFDRFLKRLDQVRDGYRFIVTVDEFELIEHLITEEKLDPRLLDFWRGLIQTYPWFVMAFAGLHTLQEMTHDYWHPLYGSVQGITVSFLGREAARKLITQPSNDFPLDYDQDAIEHIIALTHGQPYLVQLIAHGLVTRFNRQTFEEGVERERRFGVDDVEAVIEAPDFYRDGDAYFTGVWRQAEKSIPAGQTTVLDTLAQLKTGLPTGEIARQTESSLAEIEAALETLARHDVIEEDDGRWRFTVELMRCWVLQRREE